MSSSRELIYVWDMRMGRWHKLEAHTRPVLCMQYYEENRLVSGSLDNTIRVWDLTQVYQTLAIPNETTHWWIGS